MAVGSIDAYAAARRARTLPADTLDMLSGALAVYDACAIAATGLLTAAAYMQAVGTQDRLLSLAQPVTAVGGVLAWLLMRRPLPAGDVGIRSVLAGIAARLARLAAVMLALRLATHVAPPWGWAVAWGIAGFAAIAGPRLALARPYRMLWRQGALAERVAIIGNGIATERLLRRIQTCGSHAISVAGVFDDTAYPGSTASVGGLMDLARRGHIDRVVVTFPLSDHPRLASLLQQMKPLAIEVAHCPWIPEGRALPPAGPARAVAGMPAILLQRPPIRGNGRRIKAAADRMVAAVLLVLLAPLMLTIALAIRLNSPGPVIFRQRRHGLNGQPFRILKFRTMAWAGASGQSLSGARQAERDDRRVTAVGRVLRRTSLDELPQLLNVLNGTMALVGPRPHPVAMRTQQRLGYELLADYAHRHRVKPGMTGLAQVKGHRGPTRTVEALRQRLAWDLQYIAAWSPWLDLRILLATPLALVSNRTDAP